MPATVIDTTYLPFTAESLRAHFVLADAPGGDPDRHTRKWLARVALAGTKDPAFLARDETVWTAGALVAIHRCDNAQEVWRRLLIAAFDETPPVGAGESWSDLLAGDELQLYFEVGLRSPEIYRTWLSKNLDDRHPIKEQRAVSATRGISLEGRNPS